MIKRIEKGKVPHVYIGLYGDPMSDANKRITRRANQMINARRGKIQLAVSYFDAVSANVWGK